MRITSILTAITLTLGASTAYAACSTPSDNGMPAGNIPILKMSAGSGSFGAAPSTDVPTGGEMYFDVALSQMIWCDGTNWLRLDGTQAFNEPALKDGGAGGDVEDRLSAVESAVDNIGVVYQVSSVSKVPDAQYIVTQVINTRSEYRKLYKSPNLKRPQRIILNIWPYKRGTTTTDFASTTCYINVDGLSYDVSRGKKLYIDSNGAVHTLNSYQLNADREVVSIDISKIGNNWDGYFYNCGGYTQSYKSGEDWFTDALPSSIEYADINRVSETEKTLFSHKFHYSQGNSSLIALARTKYQVRLQSEGLSFM